MKQLFYLAIAVICLQSHAATWYVSASEGNDSNDGLSLSSALATIQKAIDKASANDQILVSEGRYGKIVVPESLQPLVIQATGSQESCIIDGASRSRSVEIGGATTNVYLNGFSIVRGYTSSYEGGGVYGGTLTSCAISNNYARMGGGAYKSVLKNCLLSGNRAETSAGAALQSTLKNCTVRANYCSDWIAGVQSCEAEDCQIADNVGGSSNGTGGASGSTLRRCTVANNSGYCGGADGCVLYDCIIKNNKAVSGSSSSWRAAGANNCTAYNTLIIGNSASSKGIGVNGGKYYNCTILNNPVGSAGYYSSIEGGALYNCIIGGSSGTHKINNATVKNCCLWNTSESGTTNEGCISGDPSITSEDSPTLLAGSQCIDAGNNSYVMTGSDMAGGVRIYNDTVDIGVYEYCTPSQETVGGNTWSYHIKSGRASICGVKTEGSNLVIPETLGGYAIGAIETNAFQNASNVVELTIPAGVSIADKALAGCTSLKTVNFEGLPNTAVVPGFYYAKFENLTNWLDETISIVDHAAVITNSADMMTAKTIDDYTMHTYAALMYFEAGTTYEFVVSYDNYGVISIDHTKLVGAAFGLSCKTNTMAYATPGWHWLELRGWNCDGPGATSGGAWDGIKWRKVGESEWRLFADPGDGSLFRAKMGNLSDVLAGTAVECVSFGEGVTAIPDDYLVGVSGLKSIALPDSLESLGNNDLRFIGNNAGESGQWVQKDWLLGYIGTTGNAVVLPNAVTNIAPFTFEGQTGLTRIVLPDVVESIGTNAFLGCEGLVSVYAAKDEMSNVTAMLTASGLTNAEEIVKAKDVGAPVITPVSGTVIGSSQSVSMACATEGAAIYYTTDGTTPTGESKCYSRFRVSGKTTVQAVAILDGVITSAVARAEYALGQCADPVISLADGTVFLHANQEVSISYGSDGTLRYTLDGTDPTAESPEYTGAFTISDTTVVKAKVFSDSFFDSQVVTATLTRAWEQVATPVITAAASFTGSKTLVTLTCATEGATIRYTVNGNDPNSHSTKYTGSFEVTESCTVKAYAVLTDYTNSEIASWAIEKVWGIGDALNVPDMTFTTSGDEGWVRDTSVSKDGVESMRSGAITHNQTSVFSGKVMGKGTLSFWWKTSCEMDEELHDWDHADFIADGMTNVLDGVTDWQQVSRTFTTDGEHEFCWRYVKDDIEYAGEDCAWVDMLSWSPVPTDPVPAIDDAATASDVAAALEGSADSRLAENITSAVQYNAYRAWVDRVAGSDNAQRQAVKDSTHAWLSYALDTDALLTATPVQGEMRIAAFEKNLSTGQFDFSVAIDGVNVGMGATAENLATLFGVEGCSTVDGDYSSKNLSFTFGTPSNGKVVISAAPKDEEAQRFFLKVKMTP